MASVEGADFAARFIRKKKIAARQELQQRQPLDTGDERLCPPCPPD
jgi:hypothetical protein